MSDSIERRKLVEMLRGWAAEVRAKFEGGTCEATAAGLETIAVAVEKRQRLEVTLLPDDPPAGFRRGGASS